MSKKEFLYQMRLRIFREVDKKREKFCVRNMELVEAGFMGGRKEEIRKEMKD